MQQPQPGGDNRSRLPDNVQQRLEQFRNQNRGNQGPGERPNLGDRTPGQRPNLGDRTPGNRPEPTPGQRPNLGDRPGPAPGERPNLGDRTPGQRPGMGDRTPGDRTPGERPNLGDRTPGERPNLGDRVPGQRPGMGDRTPGDRTPGERPDFGDRRPGDRGPGDRGPGDRGPGDRGPGDRTPGERPSFGDREPGDRGPGGRGPGDRGPGGRGDREQVDRTPNWDRRPPGERNPQNRTPGAGDRSPIARDYFARDRNNQSLQNLRLQNTDILDRIARNPQDRSRIFQDRNFRARPINNTIINNYNFNHGRGFNFWNYNQRVAQRMIWWRAMQLGGYRWDPFRFRYFDFRGRPLGFYRWNLFQPHYRFIVPHYNRFYRGSYFVDNSVYYYTPETYVVQGATNVPDQPPEPVQVVFGEATYSQDLAGRFERLLNDVALELHYNYRNNPDFDNAYRMTYDLLLNAKDILAAADQGDTQQVANQLYGLDQLFYLVFDQIADFERTEQKPIGEDDLLTKMAWAESTLQHLMHDAGVEPSFEVVEEDAPTPGNDGSVINLPAVPR